MLMFGASSSGTNNGLRYLFPEYSETAVSTTIVEYDVAVAFTVTSMRFRANAAGVGSGQVIYNLVKNGSPSTLTLSPLATTVSGSVTGSVSFAVGDRIALSCQASGTVTTGHTRPMITLGLA